MKYGVNFQQTWMTSKNIFSMKIENMYMVNYMPNDPNQNPFQKIKKPFTTFQVLNDEYETQSANNLALSWGQGQAYTPGNYQAEER